MAAWRVARSLAALRAAFDSRFPNRDRTTDGSIGDAAHQGSPSGHNPDDTKGSLPESGDADTEPEVRAIDVDADLRAPGVSMWDVVQAILATPADRDRLLYIIHNRRIWSKSQGWRERSYTGSNPHTSHAHFSGDPAFDEDTRPWQSVLQFGRTLLMALTDAQQEDLYRRVCNIDSFIYYGEVKGQQSVPADQVRLGWGVGAPPKADVPHALMREVAELRAKVEAVSAPTADMVKAALLQALSDPQVKAVLIDAAFQGAQKSERE